MSKYFDGYASFDWNEMSKDKLVLELKRKCKYIAELKKQLEEKKKHTYTGKEVGEISQYLAIKFKLIRREGK